MTGCPCGSARDYTTCCGPLLEDGVPAETAEALMRSRYTAFVRRHRDHLWRTWHPRTRPPTVDAGEEDWTGLSIIDVVGGGVDDRAGVVEFEARYVGPDGPGVMRERSLFERRGWRWTYLEGSDPGRVR